MEDPLILLDYDNVLFFEAISIGDDCKYRRFLIGDVAGEEWFQQNKIDETYELAH